jgi:hypothetical protein
MSVTPIEQWRWRLENKVDRLERQVAEVDRKLYVLREKQGRMEIRLEVLRSRLGLLIAFSAIVLGPVVSFVLGKL